MPLGDWFNFLEEKIASFVPHPVRPTTLDMGSRDKALAQETIKMYEKTNVIIFSAFSSEKNQKKKF